MIIQIRYYETLFQQVRGIDCKVPSTVNSQWLTEAEHNDNNLQPKTLYGTRFTYITVTAGQCLPLGHTCKPFLCLQSRWTHCAYSK